MNAFIKKKKTIAKGKIREKKEKKNGAHSGTHFSSSIADFYC